MSLVPGTVDPNVTSECHLCCPPPLHTDRGRVLLGRQLRTLCLETELGEKNKVGVSMSVSVPLAKGDRVRTG